MRARGIVVCVETPERDAARRAGGMEATRSDPSALHRGREALVDAEWGAAQHHFEAAIEASPSPQVLAEALEGLSRALWWQEDHGRTLEIRERAYQAYRDAGDRCGAARMCMWLASDHWDIRGDDAVAWAWIRRGNALIDEPCAEAGYLALMQADLEMQAAFRPLEAERLGRQALDLARTIGDQGVEVVSLAMIGSALVATGSVDEGLAMIDDAASLAVGGRFDETSAAGWALCHTVSACTSAGDFDRAAQWCRVLHGWSATWKGRHFFGLCRAAYGEVLVTSGDWRSGEEELASALDDMHATRPALAVISAVRLGRLRVRQGDLDSARTLFASAAPAPEAIVALGELDLAAGDARAAADAADRVLRRTDPSSVVARFPALELLARAHAATGDHGAARASADELSASASKVGTSYMRARADLVRAEVLAAAGETDEARRVAEDAADRFALSSAPFEAATARVVLAGALEALGLSARARTERDAAERALRALGAKRDQGEGDLSPREIEVLRLVAGGSSDAQIAERLFLSPHTVHRHIANVRTKLGVPSRAAAVARATKLGLL